MTLSKRDKRLKKRLDGLYNDFDFEGRRRNDPIEVPSRYMRPEDIEVAAFIAAALAYGKVTLFKPVVEALLASLGPLPCDELRNVRLPAVRRRLAGLRYRFSTTDDLAALLWALSKALRRYGRLKNLFLGTGRPGEVTARDAIIGACRFFLTLDTSPVYGRNVRPRGYRHHFPSPETGGAAKRMALYLRWMVRDADIDFGLWKDFGAHRLVIPLDTHIARISCCLGLTGRRSPGWAMAEEITGRLRGLDPKDPLRYDFALCHHGISGACPSRAEPQACASCALAETSC